MPHSHTGSIRKYRCAHLICTYLLSQQKIRAVASSRDISLFLHLSEKSTRSVSAMLNFLYTNRIREPRFGFCILGTIPFRKRDYPRRYTIELIDGARGLL